MTVGSRRNSLPAFENIATLYRLISFVNWPHSIREFSFDYLVKRDDQPLFFFLNWFKDALGVGDCRPFCN